MRGQSAILNLLTCLTLAATGLIVVVFALLLVFLRQPALPAPAQVAALTPAPTVTAAVAYPTLPPAWTATPSPQPSASETTGPTATPSATPTATATLATATLPAGTRAARITPAASRTAASGTAANVITIPTLANVRSGPGIAYPILGRLSAGQTAPVIGRDSSAKWFAISFDGAPQGIGWVSTAVATYDGSINDLPVIQAAPPLASQTPSGSPAPTSVPDVGGANGIQTLLFQLHTTTGSPYANIWFDFKVVNTTGTTINNYGLLAAHTDAGVTAASWSAPLQPGVVLSWTDHINFPLAGTYQVYLGICYDSLDTCKHGGTWVRLSPSVAVTIQ